MNYLKAYNLAYKIVAVTFSEVYHKLDLEFINMFITLYIVG